MEYNYSPAVWTEAQKKKWDRLDQPGELSADQIFAKVFGYWRNRSTSSEVIERSSSVDRKPSDLAPRRAVPRQRRGPRIGPDLNGERGVGFPDGQPPEHQTEPHLDHDELAYQQWRNEVGRALVDSSIGIN